MKRGQWGLVLVFGALAVVLILGLSGPKALFGLHPGKNAEGMWLPNTHFRAMGQGMMRQGHMGPGMMQNSARPEPGASGVAIFQEQCSQCHALRANSSGQIGPGLHGLFGRKAGTVSGYSYSTAMRNSVVVWREATLNQFLEQPQSFVHGTTMPFSGIADKGSRERLIAYLKAATK